MSTHPPQNNMRALKLPGDVGDSSDCGGLGATPCSLSDFYDLGAVARYHDQPPFETPAKTWLSARSITGKTTVEELLRWADQDGISNLERLEITLTYKANDQIQPANK